MTRRELLKLGAAVTVAPSLPAPVPCVEVIKVYVTWNHPGYDGNQVTSKVRRPNAHGRSELQWKFTQG